MAHVVYTPTCTTPALIKAVPPRPQTQFTEHMHFDLAFISCDFNSNALHTQALLEAQSRAIYLAAMPARQATLAPFLR